MNQRNLPNDQRAGEGSSSPRRLLQLRCDVQHYAWGDTQFIPQLLGLANPDDKPYAELWMGDHPDLPSQAVLDGVNWPLNQFISQAPSDILGPAIAKKFGGHLPYLFKVLSAGAPLSIQTHPTRERARAGFARENAAGVSLSARNRNYKDENPKPELIAALTDFYGLRGFRPLSEIAQVLGKVPEMRGLMHDYQPTAASLKQLYERIMRLSQEEVDTVLDPLIRRLQEREKETPFRRMDPEYWVLRCDQQFSTEGNRDRGLFSIFLLNLVHLRPGEAMFLPAGILHAYLHGSGVEIMANSNNVLRGGLTHKYVDVPELLDNVIFQGKEVEILRAAPIPGTQESAYPAAAEEFELRRIDIIASRSHVSASQHGVEILILINTSTVTPIQVVSGRQTMDLQQGGVFLAPHSVPYTIHANGNAMLYKATVPLPRDISSEL